MQATIFERKETLAVSESLFNVFITNGTRSPNANYGI